MIQVREYALLTCDPHQKPDLDLGVVSAPTFDWLLELQQRWRGDSDILALQSRNSIKLGSYVGYLQSPTGESIEVLPKIQVEPMEDAELTRSRKLLRKMLSTALALKPREADPTYLQRMNTPLHEWIITEFLVELGNLVRRGLRYDYQQIEEESRFIRGKLDQTRQSRQTPGRANWFHIRHDIYTPNRLENRLLKTALDYILKISRDADNWRLANELAHQLHIIEPSVHPELDLNNWKTGKLMQSYEAIKPWCTLVVEKLNPNFQKGIHKGIALMFPMEKLFESYVTHWIAGSLAQGTRMQSQASSQHLINHQPQNALAEQQWFQLKPDILLSGQSVRSVLDCKWKLVDGSLATSKEKYLISQTDLYQLYAYGQNYMAGRGHMMLIYPQHSFFKIPLSRFSFDKHLHLWPVPFDCDNGQLITGGWQREFPMIQLPSGQQERLAG